MDQKTFSIVAGVIFAAVALLHLVRIYMDWPVMIGGWMRLYRKRRRQGLRYVRILLRVTTIDDFVRAGLLDRQHRDNPQALQAVVTRVLRQAMKKLRNQHPLLVTTSRAVR
jgi:hypothetical protein